MSCTKEKCTMLYKQGRAEKNMPRDLDKDPDSHLALAGGVLEYLVRDLEVSGAQ